MFKVPLDPVIELLKTKYKVETLSEFMDSQSEFIKESVDTALDIKDFKFLSVFSEDGKKKFKDYLIIYNETSDEEIELNPSHPITLIVMARLCSKLTLIQKHEFYKIIEIEGLAQDMDPTSLMEMFDILMKKFKDVSRIAEPHKIGRNDPCPCGSLKKYKVCHGASAA